MESLEAPPGAIPPPTAPTGDVGVGASTLPPKGAPLAAVGEVDDVGPGDDTESAPEEEEEERRRCLSDPDATPPSGGICDGEGETEDDNVEVGIAAEDDGKAGASVDAPV